MKMTTMPLPSWGSLNEAAETHGASFYLADLHRFDDNYRRFAGALRSIYPKTEFGYSYKTNYLSQFIRRAHALGAYSEVVSQFELEYAKKLGIPDERIIFNGPIKRPANLISALGAGSKVNLDSVGEANCLLDIADQLPADTAVGIRCWLGDDTPGSRFGIDLTSSEGKAVVAGIDAVPNLHITGLHCHYSGDRSVGQYQRIITALIRLHKTFLDDRRLDTIDVGGGFSSPMSPFLAKQLSSPPGTYEEYAEAIGARMQETYGDDGPELILEPGMGLLADTMVLATRVEVLKRLGERNLAVVDGSIFNIKPLRGSVNLPVHIVSPNSAARGSIETEADTWDIVGNTCMEIDLLHEGYGGPIEVGDFVLVENVGAYTNVLNAPFICGTPAILEHTENGPGTVLRRASSSDNLFSSYHVLTEA